MKLEASTVSVLKNFASINNCLLFKKGSVIKTMSSSKTVAAKATLKQEIPKDFAVYDISRLLNVVSLFEDAELTLEETYLKIKGKGGAQVKYVYADSEVVKKKNPDKEFKLPPEYTTFTLKADDFTNLMKAMGVLGVPEIAVVGTGKKLYLQALDSGNATQDVYSVEIGDTKKKFKAVIKADNMKVTVNDYNVAICDKGMAHFKSTDGSVEYWVAVEATVSRFE